MICSRMAEIKKCWPASSLLVQKKAKRVDEGCLAGVVLSEEDIHARPEMNGMVGKATEIADTPHLASFHFPLRNTPLITAVGESQRRFLWDVGSEL